MFQCSGMTLFRILGGAQSASGAFSSRSPTLQACARVRVCCSVCVCGRARGGEGGSVFCLRVCVCDGWVRACVCVCVCVHVPYKCVLMLCHVTYVFMHEPNVM